MTNKHTHTGIVNSVSLGLNSEHELQEITNQQTPGLELNLITSKEVRKLNRQDHSFF